MAQPASLGRSSRQLLALTALTASVVFTLGMVGDLRALMHASLIAVFVFAFLPFVLFVGLLALLLAPFFALAVVLALGGGDVPVPGAPELPFPKRGTRAYYRFLFKHRHSPLYGLPLGVLVGGLTLWGWLAVSVLPREADTVARLARASALIDESYAREGHYPAPDALGRYRADAAWPSRTELGADGELQDAFDRVIAYRVLGRWKFASYRLRSRGFDGVPSDDDLCMSGRTRLQSKLEQLAAMATLASLLQRTRPAWVDQLEGIQSASCAEP